MASRALGAVGHHRAHITAKSSSLPLAGILVCAGKVLRRDGVLIACVSEALRKLFPEYLSRRKRQTGHFASAANRRKFPSGFGRLKQQRFCTELFRA